MNPLKRRNARAVWDLHYGPNMTPMVDVVMVILVFFMTSASVLGPEWFLRSALPRAQATPVIDPAKEPVRASIELVRREDTTLFTMDAGEPEPLSAFAARLSEKQRSAGGAELIVLLTPQTQVPYDDVVRVHEICYRAGITKVGLMEIPAESTN